MFNNIIQYGSSALLIQFNDDISIQTHRLVIALYRQLLDKKIKGVLSIIPAYNSITMRYDSSTNFMVLSDVISKLGKTQEDISLSQKEVIIPVCYDVSLGLDMHDVQQYTSLSHEEIITRHCAPLYPVYMIGFTPGFPYLGGLDEQLHIPRKITPRLVTPKGAVGLAKNQTGIYPNESPGGWQIIGQTPISIFTPGQEPLLRIGDVVRFEPISLTQFKKIRDES